ncbi:MAG: cellulase family glycosylhydrolase [Mycobacterium sp.]|uniref:cellulase family glycosylhydrolase n=1 Tax=Mycobacterium sp. TaxID=1785 RepID=UPI001EC3D55F|nr:cellulase family glycosylhydrolase [Mycobacterium sp.]MBW0018688.1 cellulase family glycosylhydrolase [Mycobacterium sp.]
MRVRPSGLVRLVAAVLMVAALSTDAPSTARAAPTAGPTLPLGHAGRWMTDAAGRAVVLHGLNQVYKVPPYLPSADGFGDDDATFLAANGFNAMRVGVIWAAVEPQPGSYDDNYLAGIAQTVQTLGAHGVLSLLDFHQDLYNEAFQGEGAPAWAVANNGLPNPQLGFPANYFVNPAEEYAWHALWQNAPAPDGAGLQDHYAGALAHVAAYFRGNPNVFGYDVLNEPWPGIVWEPCADVVLGCPLLDARMTAFYNRVVPALHAADPTPLAFVEPNTLFDEGIHTDLGHVADPNAGFSFHDYCAAEAELHINITCRLEDGVTLTNASLYSDLNRVPALLTEFGATNDGKNLAEVMRHADRHRMGWLEWAYTGNDKTSSSPTEQALVYDPSQPPVGGNVNTAKLAVLAAPYPQVVGGTPRYWSFWSGTFRLCYSTERPDHQGRFGPGTQTVVSVPPIEYPNGYQVTVRGGQVASAPGTPQLIVVGDGSSDTVDVTVTPG